MNEYEGTAQCTKCGREVNPATLVAYGDYELCRNCEKIFLKEVRG